MRIVLKSSITILDFNTSNSIKFNQQYEIAGGILWNVYYVVKKSLMNAALKLKERYMG